jgi:hypothetical protein
VCSSCSLYATHTHTHTHTIMQSGSHTVSIAITIINMIGSIFVEYTWDACYLCAVEGYPTHIRTIGMGTCSLTARIGAIIAPQVRVCVRVCVCNVYNVY